MPADEQSPLLAVCATLATHGWTVAAAESLTGGGLCEALSEQPGSSAVFRGGVVAYATDVKTAVLGVPADLVRTHGVVSPECARSMAEGVRRPLGADFGLGTTGVAGPDSQEGHPVGTVHVAAAGAERTVHREVQLSGDRAEIRAGAVTAALELLEELLAESLPG